MSWPGFDADRVRNDFLSAERFMECCTQIWSSDRRACLTVDRRMPSHGSIVYAKRDHAASLFYELKKTRNRIILVTSESDEEVKACDVMPLQVSHWFSTNALNPAVSPLPLGLGNSYCDVTAKAGLLADFSAREKKSILYVNFRPETNTEIRGPLWDFFGSTDWTGSCTRHPGNVSREEYVDAMASHQFMLCPRGNGIDTHRMWEALYLGTIPVVETHPALIAFSDLPILFVDQLAGLECGFLESKYQEVIQKKWKWEKLFLPWWQELFFQKSQMIGSKTRYLEYLIARGWRKHGN